MLHEVLPKDRNVVSGKTDLTRRFIAGALGGAVATIVAYPIDLVRTRLAAQTVQNYKGSVLRINHISIPFRYLGCTAANVSRRERPWSL